MENKQGSPAAIAEDVRQMKFSGPETHLGKHIVAEFFQSDFDALNDAEKVEEAMKNAALAANATILSSHKHFFSPHGVSAVVII